MLSPWYYLNIYLLSDQSVTILASSLRSNIPSPYFPLCLNHGFVYHKDLCSIWGIKSLLQWFFMENIRYQLKWIYFQTRLDKCGYSNISFNICEKITNDLSAELLFVNLCIVKNQTKTKQKINPFNCDEQVHRSTHFCLKKRQDIRSTF